MQIAFDASYARRALADGPYEIALFQHGGGEKGGLGRRQGGEAREPTRSSTRPPDRTPPSSTRRSTSRTGRAGRASAATTRPSRSGELRPRPVLVPTHPRREPLPWLDYQGHWGQQEKGFNNGPQGPTTKSQWLEPFTWMDGVRLTSPKLPGGLVLGPAVTAGVLRRRRDRLELRQPRGADAARRDCGDRRVGAARGDPRRAHPVAPRGSRPPAPAAGLRPADPGGAPALRAPLGIHGADRV